MEMGGNVTLGHRSYGEPIVRGDISNVTIGKYCSIAQGVIVDCGWHHNVDWVTTYPLNVIVPSLTHIQGHPKSNGDIIIGNDVWIGEGAVIMGGVTIGDGAVVGTNAVVAKDVEPYAIVAGIPARKVRMRFDAQAIAELIKIAWWNWSDEQVAEAGPLLLQNDIKKFIEKYG
jgi:acetyltransferase-like isoleucine patch superfamily enzyme